MNFGLHALLKSDWQPWKSFVRSIMELHPDFSEFIALLNAHHVEYLVVGGYAVAYYGYPRYTGDLDIWIKTSSDNADRVLSVLRDFGMGSLGIAKVDLLRPDGIVQIGHPPLRLDLLNSIDGVEFDEAYPIAVQGNLEGLPIRFISLNKLRQNKEASGRDKDRLDLKNLPPA